MHAQTRCKSVHERGFTAGQKNCGKSGLGYRATVSGCGPRVAGPSSRRAAGPQGAVGPRQQNPSNGAELKFQRGHNELVHKDGTTFTIDEHGQLYYLNTFEQYDNTSDKVSVSHDIHTWHEILGHCNFEDVIKSQGVVDGKNISGSSDKSKFNCNTCIEGQFVNNRNRGPDARATKPLEIVHTDLAGPINPLSKKGFKYSIAFTDDV